MADDDLRRLERDGANLARQRCRVGDCEFDPQALLHTRIWPWPDTGDPTRVTWLAYLVELECACCGRSAGEPRWGPWAIDGLALSLDHEATVGPFDEAPNGFYEGRMRDPFPRASLSSLLGQEADLPE